MAQPKTKGYTTLFRELGTPEGHFHAEFTRINEKTRRRMKMLAEEYPHEDRIQRFVQEMESERKNLWDAWLRGLPPHLKKIVNSVSEEHHAPRLTEAQTS